VLARKTYLEKKQFCLKKSEDEEEEEKKKKKKKIPSNLLQIFVPVLVYYLLS
jgi:hypothetical protein